ncbi:MAG: hypothetical protein JRI33_07870 [Deltaproteobacteria bacterium]|nr:hypothetical protein [Deltaproteobacteria bacterium]
MLLTKVAKIDMVSTQAGMLLFPRVNWEEVLDFLKKLAPNKLTPAR